MSVLQVRILNCTHLTSLRTVNTIYSFFPLLTILDYYKLKSSSLLFTGTHCAALHLNGSHTRFKHNKVCTIHYIFTWHNLNLGLRTQSKQQYMSLSFIEDHHQGLQNISVRLFVTSPFFSMSSLENSGISNFGGAYNALLISFTHTHTFYIRISSSKLNTHV